MYRHTDAPASINSQSFVAFQIIQNYYLHSREMCVQSHASTVVCARFRAFPSIA